MFKKFQLKNGMTVLLVESHKSPVVSVQMWVKTGSADESPKEAGISHFIEHLVFKGTKKYGVGEIARTVEGSGGELNAYTSFDQTVFYVTISKAFSDVGLDVISEMMGFPQFDETEIDNEREVVIEEIKRGQDSPHRQASQLLFSSLYKKHPYGVPVIGFEKVIRSVKKSTLVDYYHRRYVPENMTLVVAGDLDPKEFKKKIQDKFGAFEPYKLKKVKRHKEEKQEKSVVKVKKADFKDNLLYLAWRAPKVDHKDVPALDVLALIMGQGESSRLNQRLRIDESLVNYIGSSTFTPIDPGFFAISTSLNFENLEGTLKGIEQVVTQMLAEPVDKLELQKAIINMEADESYSLETVDGLARKVGTYTHLFDDYKYSEKFLKQIKQTTAEDVIKVARKYLSPDKLTVSFLTSEDVDAAKKQIKAFVKSFDKAYSKAKKPKIPEAAKKKVKSSFAKNKAKSAGSDVQKITLSSGATLIIRPSFETSVISARAALRGGLRAEPQDRVGVTELLSRTWDTQTASKDEKALREYIDGYASSLGAFGGRNTVGLSLSTLSNFSDPMADVFCEMLQQPKVEDGIIQREKKQMSEQINRRDDSPAQLCILNFMQKLFGDHPYARDPLGTSDSVDHLSSQDVSSYLSKVLTRKNLHFVVAGAVDPDHWVKKLEEATAQLPEGRFLDDRFQAPKLTESQKVYLESKKEQSHIVYGFPGLTFTDQERYALDLIQSVLAGQGGRLFLELRDKASLAYSVSPIKMEGVDAGYFGAYIGCSPDKGKKALEMMQIEFDRLCDEMVPEDELERSKKYVIGRHDIELQKTSSIAASMLFDHVYGLPYDDTFKYADKVQAVTPKDVQSLAQKIFAQNSVTSCVGPLKPWS